jgi:hypothetical protein
MRNIDCRRFQEQKHSNKFPSVDAAGLLVYQDKAAFEKRYAGKNDEEEVPLI